MLEPEVTASHSSPTSLEEVRQKRLAYFSCAQPPEPVISADESHRLLTPERKSDVEMSQNCQINNRSNSNSEHIYQLDKKHPGMEIGIHNGGMLSSSAATSLKLAGTSQQIDHQMEQISRLNVETSLDFESHANVNHQILPSDEPGYSAMAFSTHHLEPHLDKSQRHTERDSYYQNNSDNQKMLPGIFSDKTMDEMRSALGEQGLQSVMMKVARDVQHLQMGRTNTQPVCESETDITIETRGQSDKSSRSSSVDSSDTRNRLNQTQSAHRTRRPRSQSPHKMTVITKNLQQLKEGEMEMSKVVRNYSQVTMAKGTKRNSFSADEIYRQAFGSNSQLFDPLNQQYYRQIHPGPLSQHRQERPDVHLDGRFSRQRGKLPFDSAESTPRIFSAGHVNPFMYPPPPYPVLESYFNKAVPSNLISSCGPTSQFHNHWHQSPTSQHSSQYFCVPSNSPAAVQHPPNSYYYPAPPYGIPVFTNGIPLHLPPPPTLHHLNSASYVIQHQLQPHPPALSRRDSPPKSGISSMQVMPDVATNEPVRLPHPPLLPPVLNLKEEAHDRPHHDACHREYETDSGGAHRYKLQRYFSSIELYNRSIPDSSAVASPNSSQTLEFGGHQSKDDMASAVTDVTGASTEKAGGVTQRLQDLNVDLEQLRHLRIVDTQQDHSEAHGDFESLSKGIRHCPECGSANKAYMDWCTKCGEMLIGVDPVCAKRSNKHVDPGIKRGGNCVKTNRGKNVTAEDGVQDVRPHCGGFEGGGNEYHYKKYHGGSSISSSSLNHQESQGYGREVKDSGQESSVFNEEDSSPQQMEDYKDRDSSLLSDEKNRRFENENIDSLHDDVGVSFLEEIKDPVLREFVHSYRRQKFAQQARLTDQDVVSESTANQAGYSIAESDTADSQALPEHRSTALSKGASHHPAAPLPSKDEVKNMKVRTAPQLMHLSLKSNSESMFEQEVTFEMNEELLTNSNAAKAPSQGKFRKKKKKKKQKGEILDIEIFGYEETRKSRNSGQASGIVPALNLASSSEDDESEDTSVDSDGDSENLEVHVGDNEKIESVVRMAPGSNSGAGSPSKLETMKNQFSGNKQPVNSGRMLQHNPITTVHESPPPLLLGQSETPSHPRRGRGSASVPISYQRHWTRSSIAWSSYNPRELNTRSSLTNPASQKFGSPGSAPVHASHSTESQQEPGCNSSQMLVRQRPSSADHRHRRSASESRQRPSSAAVHSGNSGVPAHLPVTSVRSGLPSMRPNRYTAPSCNGVASGAYTISRSTPALQRTSIRPRESAPAVAPTAEALPHPGNTHTGEVAIDSDSPRLLCAEFHRLPQKEIEEVYADRLHAVAKSAYDKFQEMTPRIAEGQVSRWQCFPDEIWLYIFNFLSPGDLINLMQTSKYFYGLANDETLWKYITVKPRYSVTDITLATIAQHRPLSLAMVKCQGSNVTLDGLHHFFKETQGRLQELNICGCSQGSLVGSVVMNVASLYCKQLTHLDASFCSVTDEAVVAMCDCADRLESVCLNGFQSLSDSSLLILLRKHGKSLRTLELYACFLLSASSFRSIGEHCTSLRRLCLGSCNKLTDSAMITLSTCLARIEELDLRGCKNLRNDCIRKIVRNCPRIHTLVLANCYQISDIALTEIATYLKTTLRVLDVCGCNRVTDSGVLSLAKNCDRLTNLDISSTSVNHIANNICNQWLESVRLSFLSGLTEPCMLDLIHQCPRLQLIHVFGCSSLKNLTKLRSLNPKLSVEGDTDVYRPWQT